MVDTALATPSSMISELKVSGHLMRLEPGLFCIVQTPSKAADSRSGLPGVRISHAPGIQAPGGAVRITAFSGDGWLSATGDAALVRVTGAAQDVLVTIYQAANAQDGAPDIQVLRLLGGEAEAARVSGPVAAPSGAAPGTAPVPVEILAHIQAQGDTGGFFGRWLGSPGSKLWIEGFALAPLEAVAPDEIEYQAVLGRGWSSPWVEGGQFCGSRGMALPILGFRVRLRGKAAETMTCTYAASFIDGSVAGPAGAGEACEAESLAAVEALIIAVHAKGTPANIEMPGAESENEASGRKARGKAGRGLKAKPDADRA